MIAWFVRMIKAAAFSVTAMVVLAMLMGFVIWIMYGRIDYPVEPIHFRILVGVFVFFVFVSLVWQSMSCDEEVGD